MNRFCTLFDSNYLSRGLAMYRSLAATGDEFTLYVFCFDDRTLQVLRRMALPHLVPVSLAEFETEALLRVKKERSRAEYCWTCTPHVIRHVLDNFGPEMVTYLDADLFFFASPSILLDEFRRSGGSVLITEHRFTPGHERALIRGRYCVQFMTFRGDDRGREVLSWWGERCLEWCYARLEEGKFGDQKYLDDWTERFAGVHVLEHPGGGVAPWNAGRYMVFTDNGRLHGEEKASGRRLEVVFYHFHHLRIYDNGYVDLGHFRLSRELKKLAYVPYLAALEEAAGDIGGIDGSFDPNGTTPPPAGLYDMLVLFKRRMMGSYLTYQRLRSM